MAVFFREKALGTIAQGSDEDFPPPGGDWEVISETDAERQRVINEQDFLEKKRQAEQEVVLNNNNAADERFTVIVDSLTEAVGKDNAENIALALTGRPLKKEDQ